MLYNYVQLSYFKHSMRLRIAVTDNQWFRFLRSQTAVDEVNFWQPSGARAFRALNPGELLLFKLHSPEDFIVGGGFFVHFTVLPYTIAWDAFGPKNGAATLAEMKRRLEKYRRSPIDINAQIGCILLRQPFFLDEFDWIPVPPDFAKNIVQGKTYDAESETARALWRKINSVLQLAAGFDLAEPAPTAGLYSEPRLVRLRLGQGTFRALITDNYHRRCAVSGEKALPVLDAAHIRPVGSGGQHRLDNGLLLRTDIHRLFDAGYVTVAPDGRFLVSRRLKDDFDNGEPYMPFHGCEIWLPNDPVLQPDRMILEWHADEVFLR
jgi:putative restriction endonuclease